MNNLLFVLFIVQQIFENGIGLWLFHTQYNQYRSNKKIFKIICLLGYLFIIVAVTLNMQISFVSTIGVFFTSLATSLLLYVALKCDFTKTLIWETFFSISMVLLKLPIVSLAGSFMKENIEIVNNGKRNWFECLVSFLICVLIFILIFNKKYIIATMIEFVLEKKKKILILISASEWLMLVYLMNLGRHKLDDNDVVTNIIFIIIIWLLIIFLFVYTQLQKEKSEKKILDIQQVILQDQYVEMKEKYDQNRKEMHDYKYQLQYLYESLSLGKIEDAKNHIEFLTDLVSSQQKNSVWTGNEYIDFMLSNSKPRMDNLNIDFKIKLDFYELPVSNIDICVILGNLIENSITATQKLELDKRYIYLEIYTFNKILFLNIENSHKETLKTLHGKYLSSKDVVSHGWGLQNVRHIVEKYDGTMDILTTNQTFKVNITV